MTTVTDHPGSGCDQLAAALRALFDCDALEMYRRDDEPTWDAPEVAQAREALARYDAEKANHFVIDLSNPNAPIPGDPDDEQH